MGRITNKKYMFFLAAACLLLAFLLSSCVTFKSAGLFMAPGQTGRTITLDQLEANADNYDIYYTGISWDMPAAIFFDPKGDDARIVGKFWVKVQKGENLHEMISFIKGFINFEPRLYAIVGPRHRVFGYILTATYPIQGKMLNDNTVYIYNINSPLYRDDGGFPRFGTIH